MNTPNNYRVTDLDGEQVAEATRFSSGRMVVDWYHDDGDPEQYEDLDAARTATKGVVYEELAPNECVPNGASVRWQLPNNRADAEQFYLCEPLVFAMVESVLAEARDLDAPHELFEICDTLRVSAERLGIAPGGYYAEVALPDCVTIEVRDTADDGDLITDGGRSFATQPETCSECGHTLDSSGECPVDDCPGPNARNE